MPVVSSAKKKKSAIEGIRVSRHNLHAAILILIDVSSVSLTTVI